MIKNHLCIALEKNCCVLANYKKEYQNFEDFYFRDINIDELRNLKYSIKINCYSNCSFDKKEEEAENLNFFSRNSCQINFPYNQHSFENDFSNMDFIYDENNNFILPDFDDFPTKRRRKRRKFESEEDRRMARILKNRRTAEESRQRRIQKMKSLENLVSISEEREKKFKEEIHLIGIQSAFRIVELILIKKGKEISDI